jgi:plasmid stabilization system protein ParE
MNFRVHATAAALEEVVAIGEWITSQGAPEAAERWVASMMQALRSLSAMPERCSVAPESAEFEPEIRHLVIGDYRVLFSVRGREVFIIHVRHGRRRGATLSELAAALEEMERTRRSSGPT